MRICTDRHFFSLDCDSFAGVILRFPLELQNLGAASVHWRTPLAAMCDWPPLASSEYSGEMVHRFRWKWSSVGEFDAG
jgi:hypothetical protein